MMAKSVIPGTSDADALRFLLRQMHWANNGSGSLGTYGYSLEFIVDASSPSDAVRKLIEAKGDTYKANELPSKPARRRKK